MKNIMIKVTLSEVPDHVKLTGMDGLIKRDVERGVPSGDLRLSLRRDSSLRIKLL